MGLVFKELKHQKFYIHNKNTLFDAIIVYEYLDEKSNSKMDLVIKKFGIIRNNSVFCMFTDTEDDLKETIEDQVISCVPLRELCKSEADASIKLLEEFSKKRKKEKKI